MFNPYNQQPYGFDSQKTGYGGFGQQQQQFHPQQTGMYQAGTQSHPAGMYQQSLAQQQFPPQQFNMGFQPQATGFGGTPQLQPQATGFTQVQPTGFQQVGQPNLTVFENSDIKIPNIRLSFISADDQKKYEHLFRTAVPKGEQAISGDSASKVLLRSGLSPVTLAEVWSLSDTNKSGTLLFPEFALSLHLCSMAKRGESLPSYLPEKWSNEVKSFVDAINFNIPEDPNKILANTPFESFVSKNSQSNDWLGPQVTGINAPPNTTFQPQATGFGSISMAQPTDSSFGNSFQSNISASAPLTSQRTGGGSLIPLQPQQTAGLIPTQKTGPLSGTSFQSGPTGQSVSQLNPQSTGYQHQWSTNFSNNQFQSSLQRQPTGPTLNPQTTGYQSNLNTGGSLQPQSKGYQANQTALQPQGTGYQQSIAPQTTGIQPQGTGYQQSIASQTTGIQPQGTGFQSSIPRQATGIQPQATGLQPQLTGYSQLASQPTGRPGQWGFVSTPTGGIPGLNAMEQHFLPSSQLPTHNLHNAMDDSLKQNVTWAITKQEKQIYDGIFSAWDPVRKGYIDGDVALNVFGKSGLSRPDLESIWTLADSNDRGKLNKDEFAVAMHLVYRRLNGYELPIRLPPELVPPSTKYLQDSMDSLKNSLKGGQAINNAKKSSGSTVKTDGSRFKNNDETFSYVSNSRHRRKNDGSSQTASPSSLNLSVEDLKKSIREKKILLDALDSEDQDNQISNRRNQDRDSQEIESLKKKISEVQSSLNRSVTGSTTLSERRSLLERLNHLTKDKVPKLITEINKVNNDITSEKVKLFKLKLVQENPDWEPDESEAGIVGTGANGEVTESDRKKFRSKQILKQRMAALTGKSSGNVRSDLDSRLQQEEEDAKREKENRTSVIHDVESSIKDLEHGAITFLQITNKEEVGDEKWEKGEGVSGEVGSFIAELNKQAKATQTSSSFAGTDKKDLSQYNSDKNPDVQTVPSFQSSPSSVNSRSNDDLKYSTPEQRSEYIKAQAQKRMQERLAKLGISRSKGSFSDNNKRSVPSTPEVDLTSKSESKNDGTNGKTIRHDNNGTKPQDSNAPLEAQKEKTQQATQVHNSQQDGTNQEEESGNGLRQISSDDYNDDDDDDPEYTALLEQKRQMEIREQAKKARKQEQKEARLAKIKKEMEDMKRREANEKSDDDDWDDQTSQGNLHSSALKSSYSSNLSDGVKVQEKDKADGSPGNSQHIMSQQPDHDRENIEDKAQHGPTQKVSQTSSQSKVNSSNPFAKFQNNGSVSGFSETQNVTQSNIANSNPFFKPQPTGDIDSRKAAQQRASQRGLADDNDWSDSEEKSSDDEGPNRAGAAQLASLLFGGMPSKASSSQSVEPEPEASRSFSFQMPRPESQGSVEVKPRDELPVNENQEQSSESALLAHPESHEVPDSEFESDQFSTPPPERRDNWDDMSHNPPSDVPPPPPPNPSVADKDRNERSGIPLPPQAPPPPPIEDLGLPPSPPPLPPSAGGFDRSSAIVGSGLPLTPPPPPPSSSTSSVPASGGPPPNINALLGQIQGGASLKKVDESEKRIASGAAVGRVL